MPVEIILSIVVASIVVFGIVIFSVARLFESPAAASKRRLDKLVRGIGNAPDFVAAMAAQGRVRPSTPREGATVEVVRRVGLSQAGYPHRCEYCDSPLYINAKNCSGCGAPRE